MTTMINAWARRWLADGQSGLSLVHRACGQELVPRYSCNVCHRVLEREALAVLDERGVIPLLLASSTPRNERAQDRPAWR